VEKDAVRCLTPGALHTWVNGEVKGIAREALISSMIRVLTLY